LYGGSGFGAKKNLSKGRKGGGVLLGKREEKVQRNNEVRCLPQRRAANGNRGVFGGPGKAKKQKSGGFRVEKATIEKDWEGA